MLLNDEGVSFHSTLILTSVEVYHVLSLLSRPQHQRVDLLVRVTVGKHFDIRARYTTVAEMKSQLQAQVLLWSSFNLSCASGFCFCFLSCCCLVQPSGHEYTIVFVVLPLMRLQVKEAAMSADALLDKH